MRLRPGLRLGVDVGRARIGVARSDHLGLVVVPVSTIRRGDGDLAELTHIANEYDVFEIVVGLPLSLAGSQTASTSDARDFANELATSTSRPVRLVDERLSSVSAQRSLHEVGKTVRSSREVIDQVAATIILQHALDAERSGGTPPGELIVRNEG